MSALYPIVAIPDRPAWRYRRVRHGNSRRSRGLPSGAFGIWRFLRELEAFPVQVDRFGMLYRVPVTRRRALAFVRVRNSTPEPDGARRNYFLQVPPTVTSAHAAVAWTFGMRAEEYRPGRET